MNALHPQVRDDIDYLAREVTIDVSRHPDRLLVALEVTLPWHMDGPRFIRSLQCRLAESGLDFIDIVLRREVGPTRLISATYRPLKFY